MIVYGRNPVREALRGRRRVQRVFASERAAQEVWLGGMETVIAEPWELEERCGSPDHQGICAEVGPYPYADADSLLDAEDALVLALDEVQDPHNLGAVIRVAEAAGCAGVVLPERRSAEVTRGGLPRVGGRGGAPARGAGPEPGRLARIRQGAGQHLGVRRVGRGRDALRAARLPRAGGSRARERGPRPSPARGRDLRRARGPAEHGARSDRSTCPPPQRPWCTESCTSASRA